VDHNPKLASAHYDLGILYSQEKRPGDALNSFKKYLQYAPNDDGSRKDVEERVKSLEDAGKKK
jgi:tetratricopeptide (TPR) repeat protein